MTETLGRGYQKPQVKSGYLKEKEIKSPSFCVPETPSKDTFSSATSFSWWSPSFLWCLARAPLPKVEGHGRDRLKLVNL